MTDVALIASWTGYCAGCHSDGCRLLLVQHGPRGVLAWLAGVDADNRTLRYCCAACGRVEFVPATEAEDREYDLTLTRWPDWLTESVPAVEGDNGQPEQRPAFAVSVTDVLPPVSRPVHVISSAPFVPRQRQATRPVRSSVEIAVQHGGRVAITDGPIQYVA